MKKVSILLTGLVAVIFTVSFCDCSILRAPLVHTKYGPVFGSIEKSKSGSQYYSYRGIPFAKPPIGELRFKAPQEPDTWSSPLDCTQDGPYCAQKNYMFANPVVEGSEDCLYLNVYTPKNNNASKPLPVMVFIHYGGFFAGRGTTAYLGPDYLLNEDIVLVTFNYRLGIFGFLSTLDDVAPGNFGLKDQVAALRWVQENIGSFGGDKNKVTIFGQSAGSVSVHYHILSPLSRGLFHRAISQSGTALVVWAATGNLLQLSLLPVQATLVGCQDYIGNNSAIVDCLREVPAETLLESQEQFKMFDVSPFTVYITVTEMQSESNPEPFLTKSPIEYITSGEFQKVPWIMGNVAEEGLLKAEGLLRQSKLRQQLNSDFDHLMKDVLMGYALSSLNPQAVLEETVNFYLEGDHFVNISNPKRIKGFIDLYSDRIETYGQYQSVLLHSVKGHKPIWFYRFNYKGEYSFGDLFASTNETIDYNNWGVSHCDDLIYLFRAHGLLPELKLDRDLEASRFLVKLWTNFAKYGDPNSSSDKLISNWNTVNITSRNNMKNENLCYLEIGNDPGTKRMVFSEKCGYETSRMNFWTSRNIFENNYLLEK